MISTTQAKISGLAVILILLVVFSALGYRAMRPQGTQKDIDAFWISIIVFLAALAVYIGVFFSPLLAAAPVFPMFIFMKLFLSTRKSSKNKRWAAVQQSGQKIRK